MNTQQYEHRCVASWSCLHLILSSITLLVCSLTPQAVLALNEPTPVGQGRETKQYSAEREREQRPLRIPPRAAIDTCEGKKEGDPCTFNSQHGLLHGECLSGAENVFACRPFRGRPQPEAVQEKTLGHLTEPRSTPQPDIESVPNTANETKQQIIPSPVGHSDKPAGTAAEKAFEPQNKAEPPTPTVPAADNTRHYAEDLLLYFLVAMASAGLTWYVFFTYSTMPLRRLRRVTQQLAGGDLSARVGEGLVHRKNEVVELGRDIDRMAERIESLVGAHQRLIRDVSHELRSPLARLNVALELARQSAGPAHSAPFDRIERESERLNELIGQLLMLTKLESVSGIAKRTELDIAALMTEIAQDVDFEAKNNERRVIMKPSEPLRLHGDGELLRQALENIVRNAVRYTATGTEAEISLAKKTGGRGWAHIEVRDHGPGVPESELNDIFRPFYRVNDARERQSGGAGVGLAIADRAVRLHGGKLRAFNAPNTGLIMEMELPLS